MATDRQNKAWMVAEALEYMATNAIEEVDNDVATHVLDEFIDNPEVPNELVTETIQALDEEVIKALGD